MWGWGITRRAKLGDVFKRRGELFRSQIAGSRVTAIAPALAQHVSQDRPKPLRRWVTIAIAGAMEPEPRVSTPIKITDDVVSMAFGVRPSYFVKSDGTLLASGETRGRLDAGIRFHLRASRADRKLGWCRWRREAPTVCLLRLTATVWAMGFNAGRTVRRCFDEGSQNAGSNREPRPCCFGG